MWGWFYELFFALCTAHVILKQYWKLLPVTNGFYSYISSLRLKRDGTRAKTRLRLSAKRTSPFKSAGASVQSNTGSRGVHISGSNVGYTMFWGSVKGTGCTLLSPVSPSLQPFPSNGASPCAITFQLHSKSLTQWAVFGMFYRVNWKWLSV